MDKYLNFKQNVKKKKERNIFSRKNNDKNRFSLSSDHFTPENSYKGEKSEYFKKSPNTVFDRIERYKSQDKRSNNNRSQKYTNKLTSLWNSTRPEGKIHNLYKSLKPEKSPIQNSSRSRSRTFLKEYKNLMYKRYNSKDKKFRDIKSSMNSASKFSYAQRAKEAVYRAKSKQRSIGVKSPNLARSMHLRNLLEKKKSKVKNSGFNDLPYQFSQSNFQEVFLRKSEKPSYEREFEASMRDDSEGSEEIEVLNLVDAESEQEESQLVEGGLAGVMRDVKGVIGKKNEIIHVLKKENFELRDRVRKLEEAIRKFLPHH